MATTAYLNWVAAVDARDRLKRELMLAEIEEIRAWRTVLEEREGE